MRGSRKAEVPNVLRQPKGGRQGWLEFALARGVVSQEEAAAKRTRADVSAKRKAGKKSQEFCRQVTIGALLKAQKLIGPPTRPH